MCMALAAGTTPRRSCRRIAGGGATGKGTDSSGAGGLPPGSPIRSSLGSKPTQGRLLAGRGLEAGIRRPPEAGDRFRGVADSEVDADHPGAVAGRRQVDLLASYVEHRTAVRAPFEVGRGDAVKGARHVEVTRRMEVTRGGAAERARRQHDLADAVREAH